jgi:hypothetical protein
MEWRSQTLSLQHNEQDITKVLSILIAREPKKMFFGDNMDNFPLNSCNLGGEGHSKRFLIWDVVQSDGTSIKCNSRHEFRHSQGTVLNTMAGNGFVLFGRLKWMRTEDEPPAGSRAHFTQVIPPTVSTF